MQFSSFSQEERTQTFDCHPNIFWAVDDSGYIHQYDLNNLSSDTIVGHSPIHHIAVGYDQNGNNTFLTTFGGTFYEYANGSWNNYYSGFIGHNIGAHQSDIYTFKPSMNKLAYYQSNTSLIEIADLSGLNGVAMDVAVDSLGNAFIISGYNGFGTYQRVFVIDRSGNFIKQFDFPLQTSFSGVTAGLMILGDTLYALVNDGHNDYLQKIELSCSQASIISSHPLPNGQLGDLASCTPGDPAQIGITGLKNEVPLNERIKLFPNPCNDRCFISLPEEIKKPKITVYDLSGKQITLNINEDDVMNMTDLNRGVYYIKFQVGNSLCVKRIVKL